MASGIRAARGRSWSRRSAGRTADTNGVPSMCCQHFAPHLPHPQHTCGRVAVCVCVCILCVFFSTSISSVLHAQGPDWPRSHVLVSQYTLLKYNLIRGFSDRWLRAPSNVYGRGQAQENKLILVSGDWSACVQRTVTGGKVRLHSHFPIGSHFANANMVWSSHHFKTGKKVTLTLLVC